MNTGDLSVPAIARLLASCNASARGRAVRLLISWLPTASPAPSDADLLKLWKGLFYALWHADKATAQLSLASRIASLIESVSPDLSSRYFSALLFTLRREWAGIDLLRLDKFYALLRRSIRSVFALLRSRSWDIDLTINFVSVLSERSLLSADKQQAQGVNYQIAEIFLDELKEFLPIPLQILDELLKPFLSVLENSTDKVLVNKVRANVFHRLLQSSAGFLDAENNGEGLEGGTDGEKFGKIGFLLQLSKRSFELASAPDTLQVNRKVLFRLHDEFLKLERDLEKSGLKISADDFANGNHTMGAQPTEVEMVLGGGDKPLKKRKGLKEESEVLMENGIAVAVAKPLKKKKKQKSKVLLDGDDIRKKKKTKKSKVLDLVIDSAGAEPDCVTDAVANGVNPAEDTSNFTDSINFNEYVMSSLQKQFEKIAAEAGMENGNASLSSVVSTPEATTIPKKRKRTKAVDNQVASSSIDAGGGNIVGKIGEKSAKKVTFSMKNNLVWKPHSPLPPQSLRLPPSATPRGSALKKGVPPGPIREISPTAKKFKVKKGRKTAKSVSPAVKRLRKLQSLSV